MHSPYIYYNSKARESMDAWEWQRKINTLILFIAAREPVEGDLAPLGNTL